jgi:polyphosphate kinase 2 (PPK2 family)
MVVIRIKTRNNHTPWGVIKSNIKRIKRKMVLINKTVNINLFFNSLK